ncbi:MAG TPA: hypothetical protein VFH68_15710 [Polyangia bacterium]|jgi:hypothetical protein|nr:hypothetical protein [Polyangia bacterium]
MEVLSLRRYVGARARHADARRLEDLLDRIIPQPALHARFVNTLARMEYVGVRKMLKSRRAERIDLDGLQHLLDEAVHALRLKKAATALGAASAAGVTTFSDADTLAGDAGEGYFQALDRRAEVELATFDGAERAEANYLLTSAAIEVRAQAFYPIYEQRLRAHGAPFSVSAITKDEDRHLEEMSQRLNVVLGEERLGLEAVLAAEEELYAQFLSAAEAEVGAHFRMGGE